MQQEYRATGVLTGDGTLKFDRNFPLLSGRVEVIIRPLHETKSLPSIWDIIGKSRIERSKADIDKQIQSLREEWEG